MASPRIHVTEILDEILRLVEANLKTSLSLKAIIRGPLQFMPNVNGIEDLVNGLFINLEPGTPIEPVQYPTDLNFNYLMRFLYIKRIDINKNVLKQKEADVKTIIEFVFDNFTLNQLSLTNGQVLWWLPREIEWEPPEDDYISELASDIVAMGFRTECQVRTRR